MTSIQYDQAFLDQIRRDMEDSIARANDWESRAVDSRDEARNAATQATDYRRWAAQYQQLLDHAEGKPFTPKVDPIGERAAQISGARQMLDFLEDNPDVPVNSSLGVAIYVRGDDRVAEVDRIAALLGVEAGRRYEADSSHNAIREFGPVVYGAVASNVYDQDEKPAEAEGGAGDE